ncbi:MAG: putative metal-binding motif-containing protein, partial [Myxococcota bacterium]|nr:putative metal-binding motif-containing protein [Myxococcota bacterium]
MLTISLLFMACITELELGPEDFPDNERHDYDKDGLTESEGDCDDLDPDVEGPSLWYADTDGDGFGDPNSSVESCYNDLLSEGLSYVDNPDDCNDEDAGVYPGRNNEQGSVCVLDSDKDGYGDLEPPLPYDPGTDCNDADELINPEAQEVCDEVDNDCDGNIDNNTDLSTPIWYMDADGDGFGDAEDLVVGCAAPEGYVDNDQDCNDAAAVISPDSIEFCNYVDD